ncbi:hypothetical protein VM1G_03735 [Cytospora mali]|uniref:Uncharacterized protein n=1 Tax=Cytospora mali TaxID=578113 RepID=A0A194VX08_CYTMA|nr:hypothetical protein VM1G_03735 [Valsa mali]
MGLGTKIKEVLHGDHYNQDTDDVKAPGAYPDDEPSQRHSNGKNYISPQSSAINKKWDATGSGGDPASTGLGNTSTTGHSNILKSSSGSSRNKLHRDTDEYRQTQEGYSQPTHGHQSRDSGVGLGQQTSTKDRAPQGAYWGDLSSEGHRGHGKAEDLPDRTYRGQDHTGGSRGDHIPRVADQAVGGGVYNSVTGAGSPDYSSTHSKPYASGGAVHDPLTSSTKGASIPSGDLYDQETGHHGYGYGSSISRNDHTGSGLAGTGVAAGTGAAAGYGANEYSQRGGYDNSGYNSTHGTAARDTNAPGVPRSSMLDPEPGFPSSTTTQNRQDPWATSTTQQSPGNSVTGSSGTAPSSGLGKDHYGPAHEGAKVLHTCQHCGQDNDISQYFRKEAVYRLGS